MSLASTPSQRAIGRSPDRLSLEERSALLGKYVALEIYSPQTQPLRRIEAIGDSLAECIRMLKSRGLDPMQFEFSKMHPALY
ncbi:MAG TPA: hypothetical protein VG456_15815 [Candidatus Sulfopaludibacter sp.]|jgi:hypothetical protein|nr:hypothetical protein [Candidatus Sulfopaludibacter sp.]